MIDFACKEFVIDDIVKCSLGLSRGELRVLKFLAQDRGSFSTDALAGRLGLDLSTVQRAVKKLHGQEVVLRSQENLSGGGYVFFYEAVGEEFMRRRVMGILRGWVGKVDDALSSWP